MSETTLKQPGIVDPSHLRGNLIASPELEVRFRTFEEAELATRGLSDETIDLCLSTHSINYSSMLSRVPESQTDWEVIDDSEAIAQLYLDTTAVFARNLSVGIARTGDQTKDEQREDNLRRAKRAVTEALITNAPKVADEIVEASRSDQRYLSNEAVYQGLEYQVLTIGGEDPLSSKVNTDDQGFRFNMAIQRQGETFIMAYSDRRVEEKLGQRAEPLNKRIYLNPELAATPAIFEQLLATANRAGLSIQLKMLQRANEVLSDRRVKNKGKEPKGLRGDGIVIYASDNEANTVLEMTLALAQDNPKAFIGRETPTVPQKVADGIAIGDEPIGATGKSLTTHRTQLFVDTYHHVIRAGLRGREARELFRKHFAELAVANNVNPNNIAFNL